MYLYSLFSQTLCILFITAISVFSSILNVSGTITSDTTWNTDTVIVTDTVKVTQNSSLTIEAGVTVLFQKQTQLRIDGSFFAMGTADDSILFTAQNPNEPWCGIVFDRNCEMSSIIQFCVIEYCGEGYAVYGDRCDSLKIHNCTVQNNNNGISLGNYCNINECLVINNSGIGISMYGYSLSPISHCVIQNNALGGLLLADRIEVTVENCLITGNGKYGISGGKLRIIINNCTIVDNEGYGVYLFNEPMPDEQRIVNSIIWGNSVYDNGYLSVSNCCIQGGFNGSNIVEKSPRFSHTPPYPYSILNTSPCINMGDNHNDLSEKDLAGNPRIYDGKYDIVDIGAYEFQGEPTSFVLDISPKESIHIVTGVNKEDTLHYKLKNAGSDSLKIDSITFTSEKYSILDSSILHTYINFMQTATLEIVFSSADTGVFIDNVFIYYNNKIDSISIGFDVFQTFYKNQTVSGIWTKSNSTYALSGAVTVPEDSTLIIEPGVTIKSETGSLIINGRLVAEGTANDSIVFSKIHKYWNGITFNGGSSQPDSSILSFCKVAYSKGIHVTNCSNLRISNSNITKNSNYSSQRYAGGIICENAGVLICNNHITDNTGGDGADWQGNASITGGGIVCFNSSNVVILNNIISNNRFYAQGEFPNGGHSKGGGIYSKNSFLYILGNLINNNSSAANIGPGCAASGGGVLLAGSQAVLVNNTIVNNYCKLYDDYECAGVTVSTPQPIIANCIIWNESLKQIKYYNSTNQDTILDSIQYCSIKGGYPGIGNQSELPLFSDTAIDDWTLKTNSPCINGGTPDTSGLFIPKYDLAGNPRIAGNRIDIGAYESLVTSIMDTNLIKEKLNTTFKIEPRIATSNDKLIKFYIYTKSRITISLQIYDPVGNEIFTRNETISPNTGKKAFAEWDKKNKNGQPVSSGTYLAVFVTVNENGNQNIYNKMIGIKHTTH